MLNTSPRHGYGIAREVERLSDQALRMKEGRLYPALRVLEQDGLILGKWDEQEKGADRKVYALTEAGKKERARRTQVMHDSATLVHTMLSTMLRRIGHAQPA